MIRKALLIVALLFSLVASAASTTTWTIIPTVATSQAQAVVDTKDRVYYLISGSLFCYDKTTQENEALNRVNALSGVTITGIYYNYDKRYLVITYDDSNIDVIDADGRVINLPDIKNASITQSRGINDVTFTAGSMLVATQFGYVVFNDSKWEVRESFNFKTSIASVAQVGKWLLLSKDRVIYYGLASVHHERLSQFGTLGGNDGGRIFPLTSTSFLLRTGWTTTCTLTEVNDSTLSNSNTDSREYAVLTPQRTPTGFLASGKGNNLYCTWSATGEGPVEHQADYDGEICSQSLDADGTMWWLGDKGLHSSAAPASYFLPEGIPFQAPMFLNFDPAGTTLYVSSAGTNHRMASEFYPTGVAAFDGTRWADVTPQSASDLVGTYRPVFSTAATGTYFLPSWRSGTYVVSGGKVTSVISEGQNSPFSLIRLSADYAYCHHTIATDKAGNLWAVQTGLSADKNLYVLPAAKQAGSFQASDWVHITSLPEVTGSKRSQWLMCKKSNVKLFSNGNYQQSLVFIDDGGDPTGSIRSKSYTYNSLVDQDSKSVSWNYILSLAEDQNGIVWMGTDQGVISFDPTQAFNSNFTVNHIKVPRNDGTNLADYLLDGLEVNAIAVDRSNRKWLGTWGAGLYLVSADGSTILQSFTTDDSPLVSDNIYHIVCSPSSNAVFLTTPSGVMEYNSISSAAASDYSNVYAYPNPVRPDYSGLITITGLMDNSLVKIADAAGNVIKQFKASNGTVTWDGCDQTYTRVQSGVYFVIASQTDSNSKESVVSKILIMR